MLRNCKKIVKIRDNTACTPTTPRNIEIYKPQDQNSSITLLEKWIPASDKNAHQARNLCKLFSVGVVTQKHSSAQARCQVLGFVGPCQASDQLAVSTPLRR